MVNPPIFLYYFKSMEILYNYTFNFNLQLEVFRSIFKREIILNEKIYRNPLRIDKNKGCWFSYYNGILYFIDFAYIKKALTISDFIPNKEIIKFLNNNTIYNYEEPEQTKYEKKHYRIINIKNFNNRDLKFWEQYGITLNMLNKDKIINIHTIMSKNKEGTNYINNLQQCYGIPFYNRYKIYLPFNKEFKFTFSNVNRNDVGGVDSIFTYKYIIITKSYKDWRVIINEGYNVIFFQSENTYPEEDIMEYINSKFEYKFINFDNDETGLRNMEILLKYFKNSKHIITQDEKDISDLYKSKGKEYVKQFLKTKIKL